MFQNKTEILWTAGNTGNKWSSWWLDIQNPYKDRLWDTLHFQVTMLSQCFSCFKYLYSASLVWVTHRSVPSLRKFLKVSKKSCPSSSCVCAFDLPYCSLLPFSICICVCECLRACAHTSHAGRETSGKCCDMEVSFGRKGHLPWVHHVCRLQLAMDKH